MLGGGNIVEDPRAAVRDWGTDPREPNGSDLAGMRFASLRTRGATGAEAVVPAGNAVTDILLGKRYEMHGPAMDVAEFAALERELRGPMSRGALNAWTQRAFHTFSRHWRAPFTLASLRDELKQRGIEADALTERRLLRWINAEHMRAREDDVPMILVVPNPAARDNPYLTALLSNPPEEARPLLRLLDG